MSGFEREKPVAVVGTNGTIERYTARTSVDNFARSGLNLGNLAFQHAVYSHLADAREVIPFNFIPEEVRDRYRLICIPSANYLHRHFDFADLAARLEATKLPLLIIGLGIQASHSLSEVVLQPGTRRLLSLFAERCETIFVRGVHTGEFLESQGVHNFEALGCPSNFLQPNPNLGRIIARHAANLGPTPAERISFAPTFYPHNAALETALVGEIGDALTRVVCQEPQEAVSLARGTRNRTLQHWWEHESGFVAALEPGQRAQLLRQMVGYFSVESWIEAYRRSDLVIGTRIHGVSLAWQAGRPAVLIGHDMRTRELAEAMGLPLMTPEAAVQGGLVDRARALAEDVAGRYDAHRRDLAVRYVALLGRHGVTPAEDLRLLAVHGRQPDGPARSQEEQVVALGPHVVPRSMGFLERYSRHAVAGWVRGATAEEAAVQIAFGDGETVTVVPDKRRPDAAADAWGFSLCPSEAVQQRAQVPIEVRHVASGGHLANSPAIGRFAAERPEAVLEGRHHVLFLSDAASESLAQVRGEMRLDAAALSQWRAFLLGFDELAGMLGFRGHLLIAPGKEVVLADYLPPGQVVSEERPARQVEALAHELGLAHVGVAYPVAVLADELLGEAFTRGDTHWSQRAAGLAMESLWSGAAPPPGEVLYPVVAEAWENYYRPGDLLALRGHATVEARMLCRRPRQRQLLASSRNAALGTQRRYASTDPRAEGRVVLFHDWLGELLVDPMSEQFQITTTVFAQDMDSELVEASMPDVVVFEVAERFLMRPPRVV